MKHLASGLTCLSLLSVACGTDPIADDPDTGVIIDTGTLVAPPMPSLLPVVVDRAGRPFVADLLISTSSTGSVDALRTAYNQTEPQTGAAPGQPLNLGTPTDPTAAAFVLRQLPLFDALDGQCGQGNLTRADPRVDRQYGDLAAVLAHDRIWIDVSDPMAACETFFAVERRAFGLDAPPVGDCGGRAPHVDALDAMLRVLTATAASDGVATNDVPQVTTEPFFDL